MRSPIDEPKAGSYTDQSKTPAFFITILRNIKEVNEIMRFLYPKYRRNRLTARHAGGGYNDQSNYCWALVMSQGNI